MPARPNDASLRGGPPRALRRAAWIACVLALSVGACRRESLPPNFVFVTLDTTRADHLGLYGYFRDTSPALDAFGREAIVFERNVVPMATTLPTHTSYFTATHPLEHGVLFNTAFGARPFTATPRLRPMADFARAAGWSTAAFVSAVPLKRGTGIELGFESFDQPKGERRKGEVTTRAALDWLGHQSTERPFLLWVHYFDAHWPYNPPAAYASAFGGDEALEAWLAARAVPASVVRANARGHESGESTRLSANLYDGGLRYQDAQVAALLSALEARADWGRTIVVIAGDHGEGLGQHGEAGHGGTWDEQLHAPLLMRIPGETPRRVATPITAADLIPTLLGRVAVSGFDALLAQASGRDVLAPGAVPVPIVSQDTGRDVGSDERRVTLTTERWKLFRIEAKDGSKRRLLFDLKADPFELDDVAGEHADVADALTTTLEGALDAQRRKGLALRGEDAGPEAPLDPELVEQLRALGYTDGKAPAR